MPQKCQYYESCCSPATCKIVHLDVSPAFTEYACDMHADQFDRSHQYDADRPTSWTPYSIIQLDETTEGQSESEIDHA